MHLAVRQGNAYIRTCLRRAGMHSLARVVLRFHKPEGILVRNRLYYRTCTTSSCVVCPIESATDCMILYDFGGGVPYYIQSVRG